MPDVRVRHGRDARALLSDRLGVRPSGLDAIGTGPASQLSTDLLPAFIASTCFADDRRHASSMWSPFSPSAIAILALQVGPALPADVTDLAEWPAGTAIPWPAPSRSILLAIATLTFINLQRTTPGIFGAIGLVLGCGLAICSDLTIHGDLRHAGRAIDPGGNPQFAGNVPRSFLCSSRR